MAELDHRVPAPLTPGNLSGQDDRGLQAQRLANHEFAQLSPTDQAGPRGASLSRASDQLGVLASLQTGNAELVQPADLPTSPSSPQTARNFITLARKGFFNGLQVHRVVPNFVAGPGPDAPVILVALLEMIVAGVR